MTLPMAAWRVTYTPGNWLVLAGPTMLVVMLPAPARASKLINDLWTDIVSAESVDGLLKLAGEVGLDAMPDFGAFFWDSNGLHGLTRGRVRVVDTDSGEVALEGNGTVTWNEASLGGERHLRIDLEPVDDDEVLQLPMVVGAASVSAIYLTTDPETLVRFPSYEQLGVLPKMPVLGVRPRQRPAAAVVEAAPVVAAADMQPAVEEEAEQDVAQEQPIDLSGQEPVEQEPAVVEPAVEEPAAEPERAAEPDLPVDEQDGFDLDHPTDTDALSEPLVLDAIEEPVAEQESPVEAPHEDAPEFPGLGDEIGPNDSTDPSGAIAAPIAPEMSGVPPVAPEVPVAPPVGAPVGLAPQRPAPVVVPPTLGEVDDDAGGTIFSTGLAATHKPAPQNEPRQDPQVLAVPCTNGHANAPGSRACRICQAPVDSSNPRLIRRPLLAGVHTNHGDFVDVVEGVVIGRAPDAGKGPSGSYLLRVASPSSDISRNHLLVTTRDWNVHVTDLHSTNGTTVLPQGEAPFTLSNGASVQVELGTVLDLGDGVSLRIEPPRG